MVSQNLRWRTTIERTAPVAGLARSSRQIHVGRSAPPQCSIQSHSCLVALHRQSKAFSRFVRTESAGRPSCAFVVWVVSRPAEGLLAWRFDLCSALNAALEAPLRARGLGYGIQQGPRRAKLKHAAFAGVQRSGGRTDDGRAAAPAGGCSAAAEHAATAARDRCQP